MKEWSLKRLYRDSFTFRWGARFFILSIIVAAIFGGNHIINYSSQNQKNSGGTNVQVQGENNTVNIKKSDTEKDKLIANKYSMTISYFLVQFRFILHQLDLNEVKTIDINIDKVFNISNLKVDDGGVIVQDINKELIILIFTKYNFSLLSKIELENGGKISSKDWFQGEIHKLIKDCDDILIKYASNGNTELIQSIEALKNRAENIVGQWGPKDYSNLSEYDLDTIYDFFYAIVRSHEVYNRILFDQ